MFEIKSLCFSQDGKTMVPPYTNFTGFKIRMDDFTPDETILERIFETGYIKKEEGAVYTFGGDKNFDYALWKDGKAILYLSYLKHLNRSY